MVDLKDFDQEIEEMISFYKKLPDMIIDKRDLFYAVLGKESAENIQELVLKYRNTPKNAYLIKLH